MAYLEEEVKKLRFVNQQLIKKLQRQAILETEILRLMGLLLDLRGKVDNRNRRSSINDNWSEKSNAIATALPDVTILISRQPIKDNGALLRYGTHCLFIIRLFIQEVQKAA
ncbi:Basic-leucine zipper transcription factor [Forsythia ovata]|uniref:Basic-leucine zipper transcription factor n=1 Tax=Forsythia ovata TaxID=205694 RepID=A0ABD1UE91_9LAMI